MAKKALLDADIKLGEKILESLDAAKFPIYVALWILTEEDGWELAVGTPLVEREGSQEASTIKLIAALRKNDPESVDFNEVRLMGNRHPFIRELRHSYPKAKLGKRISGYIGGIRLEDGVVYRIK